MITSDMFSEKFSLNWTDSDVGIRLLYTIVSSEYRYRKTKQAIILLFAFLIDVEFE